MSDKDKPELGLIDGDKTTMSVDQMQAWHNKLLNQICEAMDFEYATLISQTKNGYMFESYNSATSLNDHQFREQQLAMLVDAILVKIAPGNAVEISTPAGTVTIARSGLDANVRLGGPIPMEIDPADLGGDDGA